MSPNSVYVSVKGHYSGSAAVVRHGRQHPPLILLCVVALHSVKRGTTVVTSTYVQLMEEYCGTHGTVEGRVEVLQGSTHGTMEGRVVVLQGRNHDIVEDWCCWLPPVEALTTLLLRVDIVYRLKIRKQRYVLLRCKYLTNVLFPQAKTTCACSS